MNFNFEDFEVGDLVVFDKTFSDEDWKLFVKISGDENPLHSTSKFSRESEFGAPIVPLHLLLMPLSKIAGMHLPGLPSLYLGHQTESKKPAFFGEKLTYSSKIIAINNQHKVLTLKTLILRGREVLVETSMNVQSRFDQWTSKKQTQIIRKPESKHLLIIGSSGELGTAITTLFANSGWSLSLHNRKKSLKSSSNAGVEEHNRIKYVEADLDDVGDLQRLSDYIKNTEWLDGLIFAASPKIDAPIESLINVNFNSMTKIIESATERMLVQQSGTVIYVGSSAVLNYPDKMKNYTASKVLATHWMSQLDDKIRQFGVRCKVLAPTFISTNFSDQYRTNQEFLLPHEVAECALKMLAPEGSSVVVQDVNRQIHGNFGFSPFSQKGEHRSEEPSYNIEDSTTTIYDESISEMASKIIASVLNMDPCEKIEHGGLGITSGWDSLAQIKIILALEKQFDVSFDTADLTELTDYNRLVAKCESFAAKKAS